MKHGKIFSLIMLSISIFTIATIQEVWAATDCTPGGTLSEGAYTCSSDSTTENPTTIASGFHVIISASGTVTLSPGFTASAGSTCDIFAGTLDADNDGLLDSWESAQFSDLDQNGTTDYDGDGITDLWEYIIGSNPKVAEPDIDHDSDGIPDWFEIKYKGNLITIGVGSCDCDE